MDENKEKEIQVTEQVAESVPETVEATVDVKTAGKREFRKNPRKQRSAPREGRVKQEFDNKLLEIRRVTRVTSGGRRFSFSASVVAGDKKGKVGVGIGKASDTPIAIEKALRDAKKNMITVSLTPSSSIRHAVEAKYGGSNLKIFPAPGKGIVAGSSVRAVLEMAGVNEVAAKLLSRSKNKINNARATVKALGRLKEGKI